MARNKKKKKRQSHRQSSQLSPENYIRKKARNLPLGQCYISANWESEGIANIFVSRSHKNGHKTIGIYLIDLKCLGVKNTFYLFNIPEATFDEMIDRGQEIELVQCDYQLAHNIIYRSKTFAESYGFKPHKTWSVSEHILEPEDEGIPPMNIEFGEDGKPHYMSGPDDDIDFINKVINTLEKNAGTGNYYFTTHMGTFEFEDDSFDEDDDLDFEDDDLDFFEDDFFDDDLSLDDLFMDEEGSLLESFKALAILYLIAFPEETPKILPTDIVEGFAIDDDKYDLEPTDEEYILHTIESLHGKSKVHQNKELEKLHNRYINSPEGLLYTYINWVGIHSEKPGKIVKIIEQKYPDQVGYALFNSFHSTLNGNPEKGWELIGKSMKIQDAFPNSENFTSYEFEWFLIAALAYFTAMDELSTAMSYAGILINETEDREEVYPLVDEVIEALIEKLEAKMENFELPDEFDSPDDVKNRKNMRKI